MDNKLNDGESCGHSGCLHHSTHPCESCGRINGKYEVGKIELGNNYENGIDWTKDFDTFVRELGKKKVDDEKKEINKLKPFFSTAYVMSDWQWQRLVERLKMALLEACDNNPVDYEFFYERAKQRQNKEVE